MVFWVLCFLTSKFPNAIRIFMFPNVFILLIQPGDCRIDDSDRMLSFNASHALGVEMLKGMLSKILFFGRMLYSLFVCLLFSISRFRVFVSCQFGC